MANTILSSILGSTNFKLIDFRNGPVTLTGLSVIENSIVFDGKLFKNQKEDGSYVVDGKINMPITLDVSVIVQTVDGAEIINRILKDRSTIYTIVARGITINNLMCENQQLSLGPNMLSAAPFRLSFKEVMLQAVDNPATKQDADSSIVDKGISYLKEAKQNVTQLANSAIDKASSALSGLL